jgi:hypothetical protein
MCGIPTRRGRTVVVSVVVRTVGGMEITRHTCLWFDDAAATSCSAPAGRVLAAIA